MEIEPAFDLFVDHCEGHTIINTSILDDLAEAGRQRFEEARLPPIFSEYWNRRPPPTILRNIRRQQEPDLRPQSMGSEGLSTTLALEQQLEQSQKEKIRLLKTNEDLEGQLVSLKEELNAGYKEDSSDRPAEKSEQELAGELRWTKALVKVANLQLENLKGKALLVGTIEEELKKEKEQHARTKQNLEVAETAACDLTDKALMATSIEEELRKEKEEHSKTKQSLELAQTTTHTATSIEEELRKEKEEHAKTKQILELAQTTTHTASGIEEELRKEKDEHAKTKQSLELAQTPTHTLSEEDICNISQGETLDGTISLNKSILNDSSSSEENDVVSDLNKQIADLQHQLSKQSSDLNKQISDLKQQLSKRSSDSNKEISDLQHQLSKQSSDLNKQISDLKQQLSKQSSDSNKEISDLQLQLSKKYSVEACLLKATGELDQRKKELELLKDFHNKGLEWLKDAHSKEIANTRSEAHKDADRLAKEQETLVKDLSACQQRLLEAQQDLQKLSSEHQELKRAQDLEKDSTRTKTQFALKLEEELAQTKTQLSVAENRVSVLEGIFARGSGGIVPAIPVLPPPPARDPKIDAELKISEQRREQLEAATRLLRTLISQVATCVNSSSSLELDLRGEMMRISEAPPNASAQSLTSEPPTLSARPSASDLPTPSKQPLPVRSEMASPAVASPSVPTPATTARASPAWSASIDLSGVTATCRPMDTTLLEGSNRHFAAALGSRATAQHRNSDNHSSFFSPASTITAPVVQVYR